VFVKLILPALLEAKDPGFRPLKYALFPPLGLAALAGYLDPDDRVVLEDEHVIPLPTDDRPDLVVMSVYITSAYRPYQLADPYRRRGSHLAVGGLHVTARPDEAARHADTVFLGPGEDTWPRFLAAFRGGAPLARSVWQERTLLGAPPLRRDLIDRRRYLCPNSLVVSRGCPHHCDFCYTDAFYQGGKSFHTRAVDEVLAEIERLPGRHLYFLDDHLLGARRFAAALFAGMRSVVIGFETLNPENLRRHAKGQNLARNYNQVIRRVHSLGIMVNGSFVVGLDDDDADVFDRRVEWAISRSVVTATFHIMTPYPGTALHARLAAEARITDANWNHYDTRRSLR
jgi:radical SAM superfamily enzyme YgiQ (UPF0313 family)